MSTKPSKASDYAKYVTEYRTKRETYMFTAPTGFVFELHKLSLLEAMGILNTVGISLEDIQSKDKAGLGMSLVSKFGLVADKLFPKAVKAPTIKPSTTKDNEMNENELKADDINIDDQWALYGQILEDASGGEAAEEAKAFPEKSRSKKHN